MVQVDSDIFDAVYHEAHARAQEKWVEARETRKYRASPRRAPAHRTYRSGRGSQVTMKEDAYASAKNLIQLHLAVVREKKLKEEMERLAAKKGKVREAKSHGPKRGILGRPQHRRSTDVSMHDEPVARRHAQIHAMELGGGSNLAGRLQFAEVNLQPIPDDDDDDDDDASGEDNPFSEDEANILARLFKSCSKKGDSEINVSD